MFDRAAFHPAAIGLGLFLAMATPAMAEGPPAHTPLGTTMCGYVDAILYATMRGYVDAILYADTNPTPKQGAAVVTSHRNALLQASDTLKPGGDLEESGDIQALKVAIVTFDGDVTRMNPIWERISAVVADESRRSGKPGGSVIVDGRAPITAPVQTRTND